MNTPKGKEIPQSPVKAKRKIAKKILVIFILLFFIIQFWQPDKNNNGGNISNDISTIVAVPDTVQTLLTMACYDCHSNNTQYPWYSNIQPVGWWLKNHIEEGKKGLNFSEFATYKSNKQLKMLQKIKKSLQENWMPPNSYTWMHVDARLNASQKQMIIEWVDSAEKNINSIK